jgi:enamine deaminase RidA (YjgF/YER057c/UK114 family)
MNETERAAGLPDTPFYRYADVVGDRLFVAGQVPHDAAGNLVGPDDPVAQVRQCLDNLAGVVSVHGFAVADVHRLTVHVVGERSTMSAAWRAVKEWFGGEVPPATLLGTSLLGYDHQIIEIDADIQRRA